MLPKFKDIKERVFEKAALKGSTLKMPYKPKNQVIQAKKYSGFSSEKRERLHDLRDELHDYIPLVIEELFDILLDPVADNKDRIRCIENILNRYDGRPAEKIEIISNEKPDISASEVLQYVKTMYETIPNGTNKKVVFKNALEKSEKIFNERK